MDHGYLSLGGETPDSANSMLKVMGSNLTTISAYWASRSTKRTQLSLVNKNKGVGEKNKLCRVYVISFVKSNVPRAVDWGSWIDQESVSRRWWLWRSWTLDRDYPAISDLSDKLTELSLAWSGPRLSNELIPRMQ